MARLKQQNTDCGCVPALLRPPRRSINQSHVLFFPPISIFLCFVDDNGESVHTGGGLGVPRCSLIVDLASTGRVVLTKDGCENRAHLKVTGALSSEQNSSVCS